MVITEAIDIIKDYKKKNQLSLVVGAGLSKNVSQKFLDWKELLNDMIIEMYKNEIEAFFQSNTFPRKSKSICVKEKIDEIINREGYLQLASEYIKRKGFREAIDVYIEERTPYLSNVKGIDVVQCGGSIGKEVIVDNSPDFEVHKAILRCCNWNNIYSFNYDNCLEYIGDSDKCEEIRTKIQTIENVIGSLENNKKELETTIKNIKRSSDGELSTEKKDNGKKIKDNEGLNDNEIIQNIEDKLGGIIKKISEKKADLVKHQIQEANIYAVVRTSWELSLRKNKTIIKLHGDISVH